MAPLVTECRNKAPGTAPAAGTGPAKPFGTEAIECNRAFQISRPSTVDRLIGCRTNRITDIRITTEPGHIPNGGRYDISQYATTFHETAVTTRSDNRLDTTPGRHWRSGESALRKMSLTHRPTRCRGPERSGRFDHQDRPDRRGTPNDQLAGRPRAGSAVIGLDLSTVDWSRRSRGPNQCHVQDGCHPKRGNLFMLNERRPRIDVSATTAHSRTPRTTRYRPRCVTAPGNMTTKVVIEAPDPGILDCLHPSDPRDPHCPASVGRMNQPCWK